MAEAIPMVGGGWDWQLGECPARGGLSLAPARGDPRPLVIGQRSNEKQTKHSLPHSKHHFGHISPLLAKIDEFYTSLGGQTNVNGSVK